MSTTFKDRICDIDATFARNLITDDVKTVKLFKSIIQHMDLLLLQSKLAMIRRPNACAGLREELFEEYDRHQKVLIREQIKNVLIFEPRIVVNEIEVNFIPDEESVVIIIHFTIRETNVQQQYVTTLKRVI